MRRNSHDSARSVSHHDVIGYVHGYFLAVYGVDCGKSVYFHARLVLDKLSSFKLRLFSALGSICRYFIHVGYRAAVFIYYGMLRSNDHERYTVKRVGTGGVYSELFGQALYLKVYKRTGGLSYPVFLLKLYIREVVNLLESLQKSVAVCGDS